MTDAFKRTPGWTSSCQVTRDEIYLRPRGTAPRIVRHLVHTVCDEAGLSHRLTWPTPPLLGRDQRPSPARSTTVVERLASSWGYYSGEDGRELWALLRLKRVR